MRCALRVVAILSWVVVVPALASAQSAIAGTARDESAGVLPGVVVEVSSEALIERVRSTVTDGLGQYRIVDLRPGVYVATFTLPGFRTARREAIELPADFTATVDTVLSVGSVEETVTVTGGIMLVDVQSASRVQRLDRDAIDNIPSGRTIQSMGQLILGVNLNLPDVGGSRAGMQTYMSVRGMSAAQNSVMVDGLMVNSLQLDGAVLPLVNEAASSEMTYQTAGVAADRSGGGVALNMIPREGGNRFSGDASIAHRPGEWQGDNLTDRLKTAGLTVGNATNYIYDQSVSQGGPIMRDKLWFFGSFRDYRTDNLVTNTFFDDGSQGSDYNYIRQALVRLTYQLNSKNKLSGYYDRVEWFRGHDMQSNTDPETASTVWITPNFSNGSVKWTGTLSSRMLAEAGYSQNTEWYTTTGQPGIIKPAFSEEWYANASKTIPTGGLGLRTTAPATVGSQFPTRQNAQASLSYVSGSHNVKVGAGWQWGRFFHRTDANASLNQYYTSFTRVGPGQDIIFSNPTSPVLGAPVGAVVLANTPIESQQNLNADLGVYAQDSWRYKRLTVNAGLRWEWLNSKVVESTSPQGRFVPARTQEERADIPNWKNWAPRVQVVYDLFGDARTAVKYSISRYNSASTTGLTDDFDGLSLRTSVRTWVDINKDDIAQGDRTFAPDGTPIDCQFLVDPGCEINLSGIPAGNPWGLPAQSALAADFGLISAASVYTQYPRQYRIEHGFEVQHALHPRLSVTGAYFHSNLNNLTKTVNLNRQAYEIDYFTYTVFNPIDGEAILFYNPTPAFEQRATNNVAVLEPLRRSTYDTYQAEFRWRPVAGGQVFGGFSWERSLSRDCGTSVTKPDGTPAFVDPNTLRFCDDYALDVPYSVDFRVGASYPLPWGITLGLTYLNNDEGAISPTYTFNSTTRYPDGSAAYLVANQPAPPCPSPCPPGQIVAPTYSGTTAGRSVALAFSNQYDAERLKQIDLKISKTFRYRSVTVSPTLEAFNVTNQDKAITYSSQVYASTARTYLVPNSILQGRVIGWGARVAW